MWYEVFQGDIESDFGKLIVTENVSLTVLCQLIFVSELHV